MADEYDDYRNQAVNESRGQAIARNLSSGRSGRSSTIPQEFRERQQSAIEEDREFRRKLAEDKFAVEKDTRQISKDAALARAAEIKFNLLTKKIDVQDKLQTYQHSTSALEELTGLDYKAGDLPNRLADIYKRNPRALDNTGVRSLSDKMLGMHENYLKDFRTDAQAEADKKAADGVLVDAKKNGFVPADVTTKVGDVTTKFTTPDATKAATKGDYGTETIKVDDTTTIRRPLPAPGSTEATQRLKSQHDVLEAGLEASKSKLTGKQDSQKVTELNTLKSQLGYRLIGQPEPTASAAPETTPIVTVGNPNGNSTPVSVPASPATPTTPVATAPKLNPLTEDVAKSARAAIAAGKDADAVAKRLQENGYDPAGL